MVGVFYFRCIYYQTKNYEKTFTYIRSDFHLDKL